MGKVIQMEEAAAALEAGGRRGTGFAYCPEPNAATRRAYLRACNEAIYTPAVLFWTVVGAAGATWIIGAGLWNIWSRGHR